ncbi:solute carrier family 25 member 35-like [Arctopsyche grandis]|uniref:solute carrier family 25 member 35-like n=1 Tax=Arctopsyche grandis TaxID=121162 RepID=UPI00406D7219
MDFVLGGSAAMCAGLFSNPLDVVKTRMQLQGELQARGHYSVHYKNVPHALFTIAKNDGLLALQKGLVPALGFQLFCNSTRLGLYQTAESQSLTKNKQGQTDTLKSCFYGSAAGIVGAFIASPFYLIKTHMQSSSHETIAVGHQYKYSGSLDAFRVIFRKDGLKGLWRGVESSVPRAGVGSAVQLTTFTRSKDILKSNGILIDSPIMTAFVASNISGIALVIFMCPFDVISTRLYNQGVDSTGKGSFYTGVIDCGLKILRAEGIRGVYKGVGPFYLRIAPHTVLCLIFWDHFKNLFGRHKLES